MLDVTDWTFKYYSTYNLKKSKKKMQIHKGEKRLQLSKMWKEMHKTRKKKKQ